MNIKVHNTAATLMIASALLLGLVAVVPNTTPASSTAAGSGAALAAPVQFEVARTELSRPVSTSKSSHKSGKSRRIRQSMAMPFFSFAPRG